MAKLRISAKILGKLALPDSARAAFGKLMLVARKL